jgi:hypothetical protein
MLVLCKPVKATCTNCKFWSEMVAESGPDGTQALCLAKAGPYSGQFVPGSVECAEWQSNKDGVIDDPALNVQY